MAGTTAPEVDRVAVAPVAVAKLLMEAHCTIVLGADATRRRVVVPGLVGVGAGVAVVDHDRIAVVPAGVPLVQALAGVDRAAKVARGVFVFPGFVLVRSIIAIPQGGGVAVVPAAVDFLQANVVVVAGSDPCRGIPHGQAVAIDGDVVDGPRKRGQTVGADFDGCGFDEVGAIARRIPLLFAVDVEFGAVLTVDINDLVPLTVQVSGGGARGELTIVVEVGLPAPSVQLAVGLHENAEAPLL